MPPSGTELAAELELDDRAVPDFPDALVALGLLERDGYGGEARYRNTNTPVEALERGFPMRVLRYRLRRSSGGRTALRR